MMGAKVQLITPLPHHVPNFSTGGVVYLVGSLVILILGIGALVIITRKFLRGGASPSGEDWTNPSPGTENASAFMAASMQGVIEKLRLQEKELARLHLLAQERAQESERLTEEVTRNMPTGLLLVAATGSITSANPAAEQALGQHPLRYRSYKEILGADSDFTQMLTACLRDGKTIQRGEVEHLTRDGEVRRLGVTISPIYRSSRNTGARATSGDLESAPEMKANGALCLMSDLTELTALQKQIRWKENLASLGEMSAGIAHEFKNALATISGYAQMIRSEAQSGDIHESSERILDQTRALTHVVTEFLRFAKPLEICYETVSMHTVIERVVEDVREAFPRCSIESEGTFLDLPGDEALLRQALLNLARNAAEAVAGKETTKVAANTASNDPVSGSTAGGDAVAVTGKEISRAMAEVTGEATGGATVSGKVDNVESPRIVLSGTLEDLGGRKWQRISIGDNGPGIAENDLPKIFLPFYTTKTEGTGLGLAIVQKVALQHGGSIEARNRPAGGAEFLLWLPLRQEPSPSLFPSQAARI